MMQLDRMEDLHFTQRGHLAVHGMDALDQQYHIAGREVADDAIGARRYAPTVEFAVRETPMHVFDKGLPTPDGLGHVLIDDIDRMCAENRAREIAIRAVLADMVIVEFHVLRGCITSD